MCPRLYWNFTNGECNNRTKDTLFLKQLTTSEYKETSNKTNQILNNLIDTWLLLNCRHMRAFESSETNIVGGKTLCKDQYFNKMTGTVLMLNGSV